MGAGEPKKEAIGGSRYPKFSAGLRPGRQKFRPGLRPAEAKFPARLQVVEATMMPNLLAKNWNSVSGWSAYIEIIQRRIYVCIRM